MGVRYAVRSFVIGFGACALAACGGGGGGSAAALPSTAVAATGPASPSNVAFTIAIPGASTSAQTRRAAYVSSATKSAAISVGGNRQVVNCTTTCSTTLQVLPGPQTFVATLYDALNGGGSALATGQATTTIVAGQANQISIVFGGIPAKLAIAFSAPSLTAGTPAQVGVTVQASDASGNTIVGGDAFATPIAVTTDDASGATALSTTVLASPATVLTLSYTGASALNAVRITAALPGGAVSQSASLPVTHPAPVASGSFADHVQNFAYYGINNQDQDIPAAFMAAHVDIVEDDGTTAQHADAFKRAGGKTAIAYTDPSYVPYCPAPFTPPAGRCAGPIGSLVASDESAWVHDASGARVHRFVDDHFLYQEALNVGAPSARSAYRQTAANVLANSPLLDGFEADDSGSPLSGHFGGFNAVGIEFADDAAWIGAEQGMLAAPGKPVIVNGGDPSTLGASYGGAFVDQPAVMGQMFEGCFSNGDGAYLYTDANGQQFEREVDGLLDVQHHRKLALCMPTGSATDIAKRTYAYASFLLAYDPQYSVYGMNQNGSDGDSLYPETQLVPTAPLTTATEVAQLRSGGAYVREFGACAIAGTPVGACAAIVNSSPTTPATLPALSQSYAHTVALDTASIYHGGKANLTAGVPAVLAPQSAVLLVH